jgi:peroxiredoxin Q/BCP
MIKLQTGDAAPDFTLPDQAGTPVRLSGLRGRRVLIYFYPEADTPGCTTQSCAVRDAHDDFAGLEVDVLGIAPSGVDEQAAFDTKYSLGFPLLSDPDHAVAEAYGAWGEKKNYGRTYMGIIRSGFVIDADGNLAAVKHNVRAAKHREWALAELAKLT